MTKKCVICEEEIAEEYGKLRGTMLRVIEDKKAKIIYVCNLCMKNEPEKYIETAKVKAA